MILLSLLALLFAWPGFAAEETVRVDPNQQKGFIGLANGEKILAGDVSRKQWLRLCQSLGQNLLATNISPGFLSECVCQREGQDQEQAAGANWRVMFVPRSKFIDIDIAFHVSNKWVAVQSFSFRLDGDFLEDMQKPIVVGLLARMIVEGLPSGWIYTHKSVAKTLDLTMHKDMPNFPKELVIYRLDYLPARNIWVPRIKAIINRKQQFRNHEQGRTEAFEWKRIYGELVNGERYWIQNSMGRNQRQAEYEKKFSGETRGFSLLGLLDRMLFESFTSNFAGFRYGRAFVKGDSAITESSLISALVEMRSGPLSGLRFYYDLTPRTDKIYQGVHEHFEMSRASLGWAWEFTPPESWQGLVSRIDLQPKIGILSLQSEFALQNSLGTFQLSPFEVKRVLNLNAELGIAREIFGWRSRLWGSQGFAQTSLNKSNGNSVTSSRIGMDTYFDILKKENWDLKALAFGMAEKILLQRDVKADDSADDLTIRGLGFNLLFIGGGITFSW